MIKKLFISFWADCLPLDVNARIAERSGAEMECIIEAIEELYAVGSWYEREVESKVANPNLRGFLTIEQFLQNIK